MKSQAVIFNLVLSLAALHPVVANRHLDRLNEYVASHPNMETAQKKCCDDAIAFVTGNDRSDKDGLLEECVAAFGNGEAAWLLTGKQQGIDTDKGPSRLAKMNSKPDCNCAYDWECWPENCGNINDGVCAPWDIWGLACGLLGVDECTGLCNGLF